MQPLQRLGASRGSWRSRLPSPVLERLAGVTTRLQGFIKTNFGVEMTTTAISVYKSKLKGKPGRKPKEAGAVSEPAPERAMHEAVSFKDMRLVKEISNRLGPARMRELVALMAD